jgi:hypothetical protein
MESPEAAPGTVADTAPAAVPETVSATPETVSATPEPVSATPEPALDSLLDSLPDSLPPPDDAPGSMEPPR